MTLVTRAYFRGDFSEAVAKTRALEQVFVSLTKTDPKMAPGAALVRYRDASRGI